MILMTILLEPTSCGATENEMAFEDLKKAYTVITNTNNDLTDPFNKAGK